MTNRYFPITNALDQPAEADFHRLIASIAQNPSFDIHLIAERRRDRTTELPGDVRNLVAGHISEIFFYRPDLLDQFLSKKRGFFLYTTPQAYADDGYLAIYQLPFLTFTLSSAARSPRASFCASSLAQKCIKKR